MADGDYRIAQPDHKLRAELRLYREVLARLLDQNDRSTAMLGQLMARQDVIYVQIIRMAAAVGNIGKQGVLMAKKLEDYVAALDSGLAAVAADVEAQGTIVGSVETLVEGNVAQIAALKQQIIDMQAQGADPTVLQPIVDMVEALETEQRKVSARLVAAVLKGTPADTAQR